MYWKRSPSVSDKLTIMWANPAWINYYKVANTDFLISSFLLCSIVGMLLYGRAFPSLLLIYEFMYPFIHSYQLGLMDYFIQQFVICFYYYLL